MPGSMKKQETIFKVFIFGDGGVGKTTLIERFLTGVYNTSLRMTIGVDFRIKRLNVENKGEDKNITLQIWDFAGEDRFRVMLPLYVKGSKGGIFMFDITRYSSLKNITSWMETVKSIENDIPILMVGGKSDLNDQRCISSDDAMEVAKQYDFYGYGECSSKTGQFVEEVFHLMARSIMEKQNMI